jgi:cyclopropane fatty-acyl-phospholipid synthase-like methyltransferase
MNNLKDLLDYIWGVAPLKVVSMTVQCKFWDYLASNPQASKSDLLTHFKWKERPFERILDLLMDLGLIQSSNDKIELTHISRKWLVENSKDYIGDFIVRANQLSKAYDNIETLMENDQPDNVMYNNTINAFGKDGDSTKVFTKSMDAMTREFVSEITDKIDFGTINRVLDIGAGLGTVSCFLSDKYPEKEFTALDLPGVAELSQEHITGNAKNSTKIKVISSDWRDIKTHTTDSYFDLIILRQILHEEKKEETGKLIKMCSELLVEGGKLIVIGFLDNSGKYKILSHIFSLNMLFEMGSDNPNKDEITEIAKQNNIVFDKAHYLSEGRMLWIGYKQKI